MSSLLHSKSIYVPLATVAVALFGYRRFVRWGIPRKTLRPSKKQKNESCKYITLSNGQNTFYRIYNEQNSQKFPFLILVHGFVGSSEYFLPLINTLRENGRPCLAIDLYGRGHSDCPDIDYTPANMRKQIEELVIMLNIPKPFDMLGYSMGGACVAEFCAANPTLIRSATFLAPMGLSRTVNPAIPRLLYAFNFISKVLFGNAYMYLGEYVINFVLLRGYHTNSSIANGWHNTESGRYQSFFRNMKMRLETERDRLCRSTCSMVMHMKFWEDMECNYRMISDGPRKFPVLVIWGDQDKTLPIQTKRFKELLPHAKIEVYESHTHMFPIEYPEKVAQSMKNFFEESNLLISNAL